MPDQPKIPSPLDELHVLYEALKDPDKKRAIERVDEERKKLEEESLKLRDARQACEEELRKAPLRHEAQEAVVVVIRVVKDFAIFGILWLFLWLIYQLTHRLLPIGTSFSNVLTIVHEVAVVLLYGMLAIFTLWDIAELRRKRRRE